MHRKDIPLWIFMGGGSLAAIAGCVNAVALLGVHRQAVCHMSGLMTTFGSSTGTVNGQLALYTFTLIFSFFVGSLVSGFILRQSSLQIGRRYGVVLAIESGLLFLAAHFLRLGVHTGDYMAAMACGLQNAMASSYSGAVIRTTHVTGMVTDLGIACGQMLRGQVVEWTRFRLYGVLLVCFFTGSVLGSIGYTEIGYDTLLFPATFAGCTGLSYAIYKHIERRQHHRSKAALLADLPSKPMPADARHADPSEQ